MLDLSWIGKTMETWDPDKDPEYHMIVAELFMLMAMRSKMQADRLHKKRKENRDGS